MTEQRIVVITGGYRGLGFATAEALAQQGDKVILTARSEEKANRAAGILREKGLDVNARFLDVSSDASVDEFFTWLQSTHKKIDVLVNNAAALFENDAVKNNREDTVFPFGAELLAKAFDNNSLGVFRTMQRAVPMMNDAGFGRIVNVSSGMGSLNEMGPGYPGYRVSKAALNALTCIFHHAAKGNVKINAVCPGWVRTEMGGKGATRSVEEGIMGIVWAANIPEDGPNGGFFRDGKSIAW